MHPPEWEGANRNEVAINSGCIPSTCTQEGNRKQSSLRHYRTDSHKESQERASFAPLYIPSVVEMMKSRQPKN